MKFRKLIPLFIFAALVVSYFTKPTKDDFLKYIQPIAAARGATPVVDYEDNIIYAKASAFFVDVVNSPKSSGPQVATGTKEEYIGAFKKFWKQTGDSN